ncbi:MAG TPA: sugar phosphate isomerase/epimerase family protein [Propionibacteriaceae bacterium]|nr:sugar phosphate isomerase/epimerase family protein [Propionibacteriaceae bacterium]
MVTATVTETRPEVDFSFFMFTADLQPDNPAYTEVIARHIKELSRYGYDGFDLPIAPTPLTDHRAEIQSYLNLRRRLEDLGLGDVRISTNVATTRRFDPTSPYREQREAALSYLRSRIDITAALGGSLMAGPVIFPYNVYPVTDDGQPIWSDALQDWLVPGYARARGVLEKLGEYAGERGVTVGIEPVDHWEQVAPNLVGDVADFLDGFVGANVGVCIDSSHVVLGSEGPETFRRQVDRLAAGRKISSIHLSAPDRGQLADSWIPWRTFLGPILPSYGGPFLVEVFNAVPAFLSSFRLTRRKFWIPGEDAPVRGVPDAYTVAGEAIGTVRSELSQLIPVTVT